MYRYIPPSRIGLRLLVAALVIGFQVFFAVAAQAHHLTITATSVCNDSGQAVINYEVTSWATGAEGSNAKIDILVNNVFVKSGAFSQQLGFSFSDSVLAPSGTTAVVTAKVMAVWGDGVDDIGTSYSTTVDIPTDCGEFEPGFGRFTGGGHQIQVGGVRVTRGLTIHCDLLLSNNLEVNWNGNRFHMTEHLVTVACTDDPAIIQAPPPAPLDTLIGKGTGRYNNVDGFTIEFTLQDYGEPGEFDQMAIKIYETANPGNVVLNVPLQVLSGGNLQAHYDQPHK